MPIHNEIKELFLFYNEYFKPLYSETESRSNEIPLESLFEVHAAFDHLKRIYIDNEDSKFCCEKAKSHLIRAVLDFYKLKLRDFHNDIKAFLEKPINFSIIDNGEFYQNLIQDRGKIAKLAKTARLSESSENKDAAFNNWAEVSYAIDKFEDDYINNEKVVWAYDHQKKIEKSQTRRQFFIGFILTILGVVLGVILKEPIFIIYSKSCSFINHLF